MYLSKLLCNITIHVMMFLIRRSRVLLSKVNESKIMELGTKIVADRLACLACNVKNLGLSLVGGSHQVGTLSKSLTQSY